MDGMISINVLTMNGRIYNQYFIVIKELFEKITLFLSRIQRVHSFRTNIGNNHSIEYHHYADIMDLHIFAANILCFSLNSAKWRQTKSYAFCQKMVPQVLLLPSSESKSTDIDNNILCNVGKMF